MEERDDATGAGVSAAPAAQVDGAGSWLTRNGISLAIVVAVAAYFFTAFEPLPVILVAVGLCLVVFVHELGHFLVAKLCDVHVETFSIGFGPALPGCSFRWGETTYMLALVPLGGYVKMVGEGPDSEDGEDDPRSFKNKPVWQRMAIISAGVIMNVLLAFACFVYVYRTHGVQQVPGVVGRVEPGSPAWRLGVRAGDVIRSIGGSVPDPNFDQVRSAVMYSHAGEKLPFAWSAPEVPEVRWHRAEIEPRKTTGDGRPVIGVVQPSAAALWPEVYRRVHATPCVLTSAAARAEPPFEFGDEIVAVTDPDASGRVTDLPPDPRGSGRPDYFALVRRLERLAGAPTTVRVRRKRPDALVDIRVPASAHWALGLRMRMGRVGAVRDGSPAERADLRADDIIDRVEVADAGGHTRRWVGSAAPAAPRPGVTEAELDPLRLPFELRRWASSLPPGAPRIVTLAVLRTNPSNPVNHAERQQVVRRLDWDDAWRFEGEDVAGMAALGAASDLVSLPELGLAFRVETRVEGVHPDSPALAARVERAADVHFRKGDVIRRNDVQVVAKEGEVVGLQPGDEISLQPGDVIKGCRIAVAEKTAELPGPWAEVKPDQWARVFFSLQAADFKRVGLRLERDGLEVSLEAREDSSWPSGDPGLLFENDTRLVRADTIADAVRMGVGDTVSFIAQIYQNLEGILTRRVSADQMGGPIMIAKIAYMIALTDFYQLVRFLGIISVNLAVINFLPIPVLDGGHMVFLIYERLRGRPAPRRVLEAAFYFGLIFIVCLMAAVVYNDLRSGR